MMNELRLNQSVDKLDGVGSAYAEKLERLDIETIRDLLNHFPHRYLDRSTITKVERINQSASYNVSGVVTKISVRRAKKNPRMKLTEAIVEDETGEIKVLWFNQPYLKNVLSNKKVFLSGEVSWWHSSPTMINPEYQLGKNKDNIHTGRIVPVYPETKGLSSKWLRKKIYNLIFEENIELEDYLKESIKKRYRLIDLNQAIKQIHFPDNYSSLREAKRRLAFDELLLAIIQADLSAQKVAKSKSPRIGFSKKESREFISKLPFDLTDDQKKSTWQIIEDLDSDRPMNRLLNGDVGSGKTIVAFIAALNVVRSGYQVAIMAPTEVLANQHYQKAKNYFSNFNIRVDLYTGSKKTVDLSKDDQKPELVIGTQALIQEGVSLERPGLVVVDEQQRFGVKQRQLLEQIGADKLRPHFLAMTATPIPRTLAISIYGDLNVSTIKGMPEERKPVKTKYIKSGEGRKRTYQFISQQLDKGNQAFVICPLIREGNDEEGGSAENFDQLDEKKSVMNEYQKLKEGPFKGFRINYLHGKMSAKEKKKVMEKFGDKQIDILISTSVVEIGVDIPGANVMMIEGAERFGLSQLHQFRGRVGRSNIQSYCFLMPGQTNEKIDHRLSIISSTNNGFKIAKEDLKIRGPGELLGKKQHGYFDLKLASFFDLDLVRKTRETAREILEKSPNLETYPQLKTQIDELNQKIHLE